MTIDKTIAYCKANAKNKEGELNYKQVAEWLEELKYLRHAVRRL